MKPQDFCNTEHSPIGAFATFTFGCKGAKGGMGLEMGKPADENLFIGIETRNGGTFEALPFFSGAEGDAARYDIEAKAAGPASKVSPFADRGIVRTLTPSRDMWVAGDMTFTVFSPVMPAPDPDKASKQEQMLAYVPAVLAELTLDNTTGKHPRKAFFGSTSSNPYAQLRRLSDSSDGKAKGVAIGLRTAIASADPAVTEGSGFTIDECLFPRENVVENFAFGLGPTSALTFTVPAGQRKTVRFAMAFYVGGTATANMASTYWYTRFFKSLDDVALFALRNFDRIVAKTDKALAAFPMRHLNDDQMYQLSQAVHSYYASTEFLDVKGKPFWVVNEGEYRMMNTFDLTADQVYFEILMNPWTVRNEMDWFVKRYSYRDKVRFPGKSKEYPGGIAFTHDMGVANGISRPGYSVYELFGLDGCFSHMTHEELTNWVLCATTYVFRTKDTAWFKKNEKVFKDCFTSMAHRDNPDPKLRNGVMGLDSSRCMGGAEITTYDSLDASLGQSRNNLYMAVKCWAAYVLLAKLFAKGDAKLAAEMDDQAERAMMTIIASADTKTGMMPAILNEGSESKIISAVEGLAFPLFAGFPKLVAEDGPYGELVVALKRHLGAVLVPGICLFKNGAWKLSSTSVNSWLSKIYLCQFVARKIFKMTWGEAGKKADAAHVSWLQHPEARYWAWSDQCLDGIPRGSKYYPRGVTAILWTQE